MLEAVYLYLQFLQLLYAVPAHQVMTMPSLSPTMTQVCASRLLLVSLMIQTTCFICFSHLLQGNISKWKKKEGDQIGAGHILAEVETDKATIEWESQEEGYIAKIIMGDGSKDVAVGTPVAILVEEAESVAAFKNYTPGGE